MPDQRILIVDDFAGFRRFLSSALQQRSGLRIIGEASDGLEAIQLAKELQPDLILLDIGLPKLNGFEVATQIRQLAPRAKLLFVSQQFFPGVVLEALRLGALGYIYKPRAHSDLLPAIEAALRNEQFVSSGLEFNEGTDVSRHHEVQFYSTDSVFLESFARFIATAMRVDDPVIVVATKPHREGLVQKLEAEGFDVDGAMRQGTYISLDAADMLSTIMVGDMPDLARFLEGLCGRIESAAGAAKKEHPRIVLSAECVGLLCAEGNTNAAIQLEKVGNELIQTHNVDILCAYPLSGFHGVEDDLAFRSICAEHTCTYCQ